MNDMNLIDKCEKILNKLSRQQLDHYEVYALTTKNLDIGMEKNSIKDFTESLDSGYGIRIVKNKRIGFAYSTSFTNEEIDNLIKKVIGFSKIENSDPDFKNLPFKKEYPKLHKLFDPALKDLDPEIAIDNLNKIANAANINEKIYSISAGFSVNIYHDILLNSNNIQGESDHSVLDLYSNITTKDGNKTGSSFDFQSVRFLKEIQPEKIGKNAADLALKSLNSKKIKTGRLPVILHPIASSVILGSGIGQAINGETIQYQQSYLTDKIGEKLFIKNINIEDDGLFIKKNSIPGMGSGNFDAEGYPTQKTTIFKDGILNSYIHNSYTANKANIPNTGNASRSGYESPPTISINNLVIHSGNDGDLLDIIENTKEGIILYYTGDTPNIITGDLSALIHTGFYIKDGEIVSGIKNTMLGINMLEFFKNIDLIGSEIESVGRIHTPVLKISNIKISGQ